ncbi:DUF2933 domain-containing protein (plasmid) [Streptomyces mirabilis]|uniref:DUF2933 domain-containing protein n=1 Tax=Streptomyces mirabilis TaxID=68239 RepID=UPI001BAF6FA1|nr:DUF2933 domain-containing protein [Streptomyces mirabilis]QUW85473.1 DUF2933 domain-containing protein [Streptomyces mirabilis]
MWEPEITSKLLTGVAAAVAAVAVLLWLGVPPLVLVLLALVVACPLSMAFMHGGHGDGTNADHQHGNHDGADLRKRGPHHH